MQFGDKLAALLDEKNISQKEFANMLSIAPSTLNGYIKNKRQPDFELVKQIATSFNVSTDYLLDYNSKFSLTTEELSILSSLRKLNQSQRELIYDILNIMIKRNDNIK